jgi:hypothetical protein
MLTIDVINVMSVLILQCVDNVLLMGAILISFLIISSLLPFIAHRVIGLRLIARDVILQPV